MLARPQPAGREGQGIAQGREGSLRSGEQHLRCKTVHIHHCLKAKPTSAAALVKERKGGERSEKNGHCGGGGGVENGFRGRRMQSESLEMSLPEFITGSFATT